MKGMFKRALAGVAAAALAVTGLALGAGAANAAETDETHATSITIHNAQDGHTYTAYEFASFKYEGNDDADGNPYVSVDTNEGWNDTLETAVTAANLGVEVPDYYRDNYAAFLANLTPENLRKVAEQLKNYTGENGVEAGAVAENGDAVISSLTAGRWYIVTDSYNDAEGAQQHGIVGIVATAFQISEGKYATTVVAADLNGQADIEAMGEMNAKTVAPGEDEKPDKNGTVTRGEAEINVNGTRVNVGDIVKYTVEVPIPDYTDNYDQYDWIVTDTADAGLRILNDDAHPITAATDGADVQIDTPTIDTTTVPGKTVTTVKITNAQELAGKTVTVTYYAEVTKDIVNSVGATNKVSAGHTADDSVEGDPVTVKTAGLSFHKHGVDAEGKSDTTVNLEGVTFKIYRGDNNESESDLLKFTNGVLDMTSGSDTVASDSEGNVSVSGLGEGDYTIVEQNNPVAGYDNTYKAKFTIHIDGADRCRGHDAVHRARPADRGRRRSGLHEVPQRQARPARLT